MLNYNVIQSSYALKLLDLICALLPHTDDVKERFVIKELDKESKLLYNNVKSNLNLIDFHHVLNILLISNDKELGQIKFRHLSKLKNLIPNFTSDLVATSSHDPEVIFNFSTYKLSSGDKDLLSKGLRFAIPPKQIDYSNFMREFELLCRSTLDLSMTTEEKDRFKTKLKDVALSSFKLFSDSCKFQNNLFAEEINSLKALMRNKDIIIQKADKSNTVVITDKDKYTEGVKSAISDSNKSVQLNITPDNTSSIS